MGIVSIERGTGSICKLRRYEDLARALRTLIAPYGPSLPSAIDALA